jgi:hypothetical protein
MLHHGMTNTEALHQAVARIIAGSGLRYALVWMEVGTGTACERIRDRETMESTFDRLSQEQAARILDLRGPHLRRLYQTVSRAVGADTLELDGTRPLADKCAELCRFIESGAGRVGR